MPRTKLYAVERFVQKPDGLVEVRFLCYKPVTHPQGATWTTNIAKASRWMNRQDALDYRAEVIKNYNLRELITIREV